MFGSRTAPAWFGFFAVATTEARISPEFPQFFLASLGCLSPPATARAGHGTHGWGVGPRST
jgi:hypothetical protein